MGPAGASPRVSGKARSSPEMVRPAYSRRRLLPAEERLRLADAPERVPYSRQTVYYHFRKWRRDGRLRQAHDRLRATVRESEGKDRDPSGAVLDSQVVRTTGVGGPERGYDGAKRLAGRKRHLLVDTGGLVLGVHVHTASLHDRDGGRELLSDELQGELPRLAVLWADAAYTGRFREWVGQERGWRVEVPRHPDRQLAVEVRPGEEASGIPGTAAQVGSREDLLVARASASAGQGLRASAGDRGGYDPRSDESYHAPPARSRGLLRHHTEG